MDLAHYGSNKLSHDDGIIARLVPKGIAEMDDICLAESCGKRITHVWCFSTLKSCPKKRDSIQRLNLIHEKANYFGISNELPYCDCRTNPASYSRARRG
jgi:hypothetical protein